MDQELDYAQMLEIPVSTVNVVKKKSVFKRMRKKNGEDLKDRVVESVNERVGSLYDDAPQDGGQPLAESNYAETENYREIDVAENSAGGQDGGENALSPRAESGKKPRVTEGVILITETVAACLIAFGIFLTNLFMPDSAINTFIGGLSAVTPKEASYTDFELTSVVSELSDAEVTLTDDGVLCFTEQTSVYPVCKGTISSIEETEGLYTVKIAHTSSFCSVFTGLTTVYYAEGDSVAANLPFAYSAGTNEVRVSMYNGSSLLNCYSLSGVVPVWNS